MGKSIQLNINREIVCDTVVVGGDSLKGKH